MQAMTASEFRDKWLSVFGQVAATGKPVLITKWGKPFLQLEPAYDLAPPQDTGPAFVQVRVVSPDTSKIS
ncbi:MAG: hypothetical protein P4K94_05675 [Terracidiphilus sp.]|jgi:antitoxin (DNA-binding transcriptional repressor) of toxin-antitoxin stability system|nr:hypothetical protein [Terracidiphilus sp.]